MKSRFGLYLIAFLCPPLYFFLQGKKGLGIAYTIGYVLAFLPLMLGIGFFMWLIMAAHAMFHLSTVMLEDTIQRQAEVLSARMNTNRG